jgi:hypothetical protein
MVSSFVGYLASALVLCTFLTRTMLPLRFVALGSNVAFITYGALLHLYPVLVLHCVLLPVNAAQGNSTARQRRPRHGRRHKNIQCAGSIRKEDDGAARRGVDPQGRSLGCALPPLGRCALGGGSGSRTSLRQHRRRDGGTKSHPTTSGKCGCEKRLRAGSRLSGRFSTRILLRSVARLVPDSIDY